MRFGFEFHTEGNYKNICLRDYTQGTFVDIVLLGVSTNQMYYFFHFLCFLLLNVCEWINFPSIFIACLKPFCIVKFGV